MWATLSGAHARTVNPHWYQTPELVAEHRAALTSAADRRRLRRILRSWRRAADAG